MAEFTPVRGGGSALWHLWFLPRTAGPWYTSGGGVCCHAGARACSCMRMTCKPSPLADASVDFIEPSWESVLPRYLMCECLEAECGDVTSGWLSGEQSGCRHWLLKRGLLALCPGSETTKVKEGTVDSVDLMHL